VLARTVARRYLFARSLPTAVNVLTLISTVGIALGAAALIVVLSVFNGFHGLISDVFGQLDPDLRVEAATGRHLAAPDSLRQLLSAQPGVTHTVSVVEGRAVLQYREHQALIRLRGVDTSFGSASSIRALVFAGRYALASDTAGFGRIVVGSGVARTAQLNLLDGGTPIQLFTLVEGADLVGAPDEALRSRAVFAAGVFSLQKEYDDQLVFTDLAEAQALLGRPGQLTAIELTLADATQLEARAAELRALLGPRYRILTAAELHPTLYQIFLTEKAAGYLILTLMLVLLASTVAGTLTLIVIDKRADLAVLQTLGASRRQLASIVLTLGLAIGLVAATVGLLLGLGLVWSQRQWAWLKINAGESFIVDAFPVRIEGGDVLMVFATVVGLALLASLLPAWRVGRDTVVAGLADR